MKTTATGLNPLSSAIESSAAQTGNTQSAPYQLNDLRNAAVGFFKSTIGTSLNISKAYDQQHPVFFQQSLKPSTVDQLVSLENRAVKKGTATGSIETIARLFTPLRRPVAHLAAQHATLGETGFNKPSEYSQEAQRGILSDF